MGVLDCGIQKKNFEQDSRYVNVLGARYFSRPNSDYLLYTLLKNKGTATPDDSLIWVESDYHMQPFSEISKIYRFQAFLVVIFTGS